MLSIELLKSYDIGIPEMRRSQSPLISTLERMHMAYADQQEDVCRALVPLFVGDIDAYFRWEESFLDEHGYPHRDRCVGNHKLFRVRLHKVRAASQAGDDAWTLENIIDALTSVLVANLTCEGLALRSFFDRHPTPLQRGEAVHPDTATAV